MALFAIVKEKKHNDNVSESVDGSINIMNIKHWDSEKDGSLTEEEMRRKMENLGFEVIRYVYPPGKVFPVHSHVASKLDGVISGRFEVSMGSKSVVLEAGDILFIPEGVDHSAKVVGENAVASLDGIMIG